MAAQSDGPLTEVQAAWTAVVSGIGGAFAFMTAVAGGFAVRAWRHDRDAGGGGGSSGGGDSQEGGEQTPEPPGQIWGNVPPRDPRFTNRAEALDLIHSLLRTEDSERQERSCVLLGLGGVGKTSLAAEYARRYQGEYRAIWWVNAEQETSIQEGMSVLAGALSGAQPTGRAETLATIRRKLRGYQPWLVVFDNAEDPATLRDYWPSGSQGDVLVTARDKAWVARCDESITVELLSRADAVTLLQRATPGGDEQTAAEVADSVGRLPLALVQAASYIEESSVTFARYAELLERNLERMVRAGQAAGPNDDADSRTVATTWSVSFEAAAGQRGARELLSLCAFLAPDDIPRGLLREYADQLPEPLDSVAADPIDYDLAVAAQCRYGLLKADSEHLSLHRLVQGVVRANLSEPERVFWAHTAVRLLERAFPDDGRDSANWETCGKLAPHAVAATEREIMLGAGDNVTARLLHRTGDYLFVRGIFRESVKLLQNAVTTFEQIEASESAEAIAAMSRLAQAQSRAGYVTESLRTAQGTLRLRERQSGTQDPGLIEDLLMLGRGFRDLNRLSESGRQLDRALTLAERSYGPADPRLAPVLCEVANTQRRLGALGSARATMDRALALPEVDDAQRAALHYYMGLALRDMRTSESFEAGKGHLQDGIDLYTRIFGDGYALALRAEQTLSDCLSGLGEAQPAYDHASEAVGGLTELEGPEHPNVGEAVRSQATAMRLLARPAEAITVFERALAIFENFWTKDHPYVAEVLVPLSAALRDAGRFAEAEEALHRARTIAERERGVRHPDYASVLEELGELKWATGHRTEARDLTAEATDIRHAAAHLP